MVVVADNSEVTSLKGKYEYLPSWVRSVHTTLKLKNTWVIVCPKVQTRANVPKNPKTWVTVEIGQHTAKTVTRSERGKAVAERLKHGRNVGKRCPDGRNVKKRSS
jgi:uncharacterized protein YbbK (DUF523 family)